MIRELGIRSAARGSGAGSLVNYLLGISGVDPIRHGLLMERFLSPLRRSLPDIDIDVESARRLEVYDAILERFGTDRCATVSMMDTYKVRHAIRDVGAALGMPMGEIDAIAKAFPHIRARDARMALRDLPELRSTGMAREAAAGEWGTFDMFFRLVESLDGLPRHIAMHPCGVLLSDRTLLDRTPVEQSFLGYPMSQFDKEDVEDLGLLKLDVLGIRMQSSMAHAVTEIERVEGRAHRPRRRGPGALRRRAAPTTMISAAKTLGVFQIESPGQRELVGKSGIETFEDIIADISLFRPGPVKSDMITPYLEVKNGWKQASYLHDDLRPILGGTRGVVVFHEQVIEMIAQFAGCSYAEGDEWRRALGDKDGMAETKTWFYPRALAKGYALPVVEQIWKVIEAFASFGFCKAHAAAFALPTYQSAWLKAHYPAHFISGVLTHDPGMYPKRLILDDARQLGIAVLGLDVNASRGGVRRGEAGRPEPRQQTPTAAPTAPLVGHPSRSRRGSAGSSPGEGSTPSCRPRRPTRTPGWATATASGSRWGRCAASTTAEVHRIVTARDGAPYSSLTDFWQRAQVSRPVVERLVQAGAFDSVYGIGASNGTGRRHRVTRRDLLLEIGDLDRLQRASTRATKGRARGLARARPGSAESGDASVQLALDLGATDAQQVSGLPEMTDSDRVRAELDILGLDASRHVVDFHKPFLDRLGVTRSADLLSARSRSELLVAGVKVATQTPPIRTGRRVIFLTLDDTTGPVDATFFEDVQGPYAATVFGSWLLVVRGELRRTGRRGVSLRATGAWDLGTLSDLWRSGGMDAVHEEIDRVPLGFGAAADGSDRSDRGPSRVMVHTSGFRMSPYADIKPAGALSRHRHRRGGPQAVAPQPRELGMTPQMTRRMTRRMTPSGRPPRPLGWRPWNAPSSAAAPPAPPWCGTPCGRCSSGPTVPGSSRSSTSAAAPAGSRSGWRPGATGSPSSTPAPTLSPPSPVVPTRRGWPTGSPGSRATWATSSSWLPRTVSTWCCATASSVWSRTLPRRCRRSPRSSGPVVPSPCWSASGTPPCSPARWPATSPRRGRCSTATRPTTGPTGRPSTGSPPTRSTTCSSAPASPRPAPTASASSPTWCPPPCSTSSPARVLPSSSWSARSPSAPSTSPSPASSTSSPRAETSSVSPGPLGNPHFPRVATVGKCRFHQGPGETCDARDHP